MRWPNTKKPPGITPPAKPDWSCDLSAQWSMHAIHLILDAPDTWGIFEEDIRRCLTRIFPYAILYTVEPDHILIVAIMHSHREPGYWRKRLA